MLNISEESGGEEGIQINKTISLCRGGNLGIQSAPPASPDYHSQPSTAQSSGQINQTGPLQVRDQVQAVPTPQPPAFSSLMP